MLTVLLFAATFVYRFNTLGGRFGGFENDHFVPFAYAKQVQAGEQPLRDFTGLGLQGAWPSLTFETSALAQRWLGDNLRSEAIVTVTAVALAAACTFLAATAVSSVGWGFAAALLSVLIAPALYNYTKVLTLSGAALAIARYAHRPTSVSVAAMAVATAAGFLFRHDLAVYIGIGVVAVCLLVGPWSLRWKHVATYGLLTLLLLTPSLVYVQRHAGIVQYFLDGLALSQREAERTPLLEWPSFAMSTPSANPVAFFAVESNAEAWLFYATWLLPLLAVMVSWRASGDERGQSTRAAVMAIAAASIVASWFMIRGNVIARIGDISPLFAVLFAVVCRTATRARSGVVGPYQPWRALPVIVILTGTVLSANTAGSVVSQLQTARLTSSLGDIWQQMQRASHELAAEPQSETASARDGDPLVLARYLRDCTAPTDRVLLMTYRPELLPFAGRLFAGGRLSVIANYVLDQRHQRDLVAKWASQSVPVVLVQSEPFYDPASPVAPIVRDYLLEHYRLGAVSGRDAHAIRVFVRRDLTPRSSFGEDSLPCLQ